MRLLVILLLFTSTPLFSNAATLIIPRDYPTIQQGIDKAYYNDTVLVSPGVYVENINFKGKIVIVKSMGGPSVTIIDGGNPSHPHHGSVVVFASGEKLSSVLEGFTITNGSGTNIEYSPGNWGFCGGGILCVSSSPLIKNNIIKENSASRAGGGIYCNSSSPNITRNILSRNSTSTCGGGIACENSSSPLVTDNIITLNAACFGGGIDNYVASPNLSKNRISENIADFGGGICCTQSSLSGTINTISNNIGFSYGGGIYTLESTLNLLNSTIIGNESDCGGGICQCNSSSTITNNTISNNAADSIAGGLYFWKCSSVITNCILWNDVAPKGPEIYLGETCDPSFLIISHSDVKGGKSLVHVEPKCTLNWGAGMIDADPLFADPVNNDFHLKFQSPCKDTGYNAAAVNAHDFEGDPRIVNSTVDMGADEFHTHLYYTGDASAGSNINLKLVDIPNTSPVILWLGSGVMEPPMSLFPYGDWHLQFPILLQAQLGSIPGPDGILSLPCTIPANFPPVELPLQAGIGMKLTNLLQLKIQ